MLLTPNSEYIYFFSNSLHILFLENLPFYNFTIGNL